MHEIVDHGKAGGIEVKFNGGWTGGVPGLIRSNLAMTIDNQEAWPAFLGKVGGYWTLALEFAAPTDSEHAIE